MAKEHEIDVVVDLKTNTFELANKIDYKFNEGALIEEFKAYIDSTYGQHYAKDKFQATEFIIDAGHGMSFCLGNVLKYAQRYGHKDGHNSPENGIGRCETQDEQYNKNGDGNDKNRGG